MPYKLYGTKENLRLKMFSETGTRSFECIIILLIYFLNCWKALFKSQKVSFNKKHRVKSIRLRIALFLFLCQNFLGVKRVTEPNQTEPNHGIIPNRAYDNFRLLRYRVLPPSPNRTNECDINCLFYLYFFSFY